MLNPPASQIHKIIAFLALVWVLLSAGCSMTMQDTRPNIILVMTDDQGYGDIRAHGNSMLQTPNLDKLHAESVRLTNFHVDPTCSPTRSALMTGRYSSRTGVWHTIMGRSIVHREEVMVADLLSDAGYSTGFFGKWHLGDSTPYRPIDRGFQEAVFHGGGGVGQAPDYWGNDYFDDTYWHNDTPQPYEGYCTDVFFNNALRFIEEKTAQHSAPFFVYLATNAPHGPFLVDEKYSKPYADKNVPDPMDKFYGMIENIDENMGQLVSKLEELNITDKTILIFMTDNGTSAGTSNTHPTQRVNSQNAALIKRAAQEVADGIWQGHNAGMRGRKGSEYEGGHRVPFYIRWPSGNLGNPRDIEKLAAHIDVLPTLADAAGMDARADLDWDGSSLLPLLRGEKWQDRTLFVHSQRIRFPEMWRKSSVMTEQYRLINGTELYDILADPGQLKDLAADQPESVEALRQDYMGWWEHISNRFEQHVHLDIGSDAQNPVRISSHDWLPPDDTVPVPWHQSHVRDSKPWNGTWNIQVTQAGKYEFELYQRDKPANHPIAAVEASIEIGNRKLSQTVPAGAVNVRFEMDLPAGKTTLHTSFKTTGGEEQGAFYIYAKRL